MLRETKPSIQLFVDLFLPLFQTTSAICTKNFLVPVRLDLTNPHSQPGGGGGVQSALECLGTLSKAPSPHQLSTETKVPRRSANADIGPQPGRWCTPRHYPPQNIILEARLGSTGSKKGAGWLDPPPSPGLKRFPDLAWWLFATIRLARLFL